MQDSVRHLVFNREYKRSIFNLYIAEKQFRHRERRSSLPPYKYPEWGNYFGEMMNFNIPAIPYQIFLIRPEYAESITSAPFENIEENDYMMSDCSSVDYIVEDENFNVELPHENMVEVSIETNNTQQQQQQIN